MAIGFCMYGSAMDTSDSEGCSIIDNIAVSSDGNFVAASLWNGDVCLFDCIQNTRNIISLSHDMRVPIGSLAYDEYLAIGHTDGVVRIIDRKLQEILFLKAHDAVIFSLSLDGNVLATASADSYVKVWDIMTCRCLNKVKVDRMGHVLLVNSSKNLLCVSSGYAIVVIDFKEDKIISTLQGHVSSITACVLHNDYIWTCSKDGTLRKWNIATGECLMIIKSRHIFSSLSISTNGQLLIGVSKTGVAGAWDVETGLMVEAIEAKKCSGELRSRNYLAVAAPHDAVVFSSEFRNVLVYKIGTNTHRIPIVNELNCSIDDIELYDKSIPILCNKACRCNPQLNTCLDLKIHNIYASYKLFLKIAGVLHVVDNLRNIRAIQRMVITRSIQDGRLALMLGRRSTRQNEELEFKGYYLVADSPLYYHYDEPLNILAYTIGDHLTSFVLTDTHGVCVHAQPYMGFSSVFTFDNVLQEGPYALSAETCNMRYQWSIPFLSPRTELLLTVKPCQVKLKLYEESAEQLCYAPLRAQESLPIQKSPDSCGMYM
jgi:hypothetical protein